LVGEDVDLNARERTANNSHRASFTPIVGSVLRSVDKEGRVVTDASTTATTNKIRRGKVGTHLLRRRPEIESASLFVRQDGAIGDQDAIHSDTLPGVGQLNSVVVDGRVSRILEAIKVPVDLRSISKSPQSLNCGILT
jgi:hypothetical protein